MILGVILILIGLILVVYIWWTNPEPMALPPEDIGRFDLNPSHNSKSNVPISPDEIPIPTMHSVCDRNQSCGGDLVCDPRCRRCKMKAGGDCAGDVDCDRGLRCQNWKCVPAIDSLDGLPDAPDSPEHSSEHRKHIQWQL